MNSQQQLTQQINKDITISIVPTNAETNLEESIYAINWFDRKRKSLYNLYTTLTGPLALNVGARLHFKGRHIEKIEGDDADKREMLLIVRYPSAESFLKLLANKLFQITSLLRINSVKDFNFGFTKRISPSIGKRPKTNSYLVHHFRTNSLPDNFLEQLLEISFSSNTNLYYAGTLAANLVVTRDNLPPSKSPFLMDGILVFESDDAENFSKLLDNAAYRKVKSNFSSNYTAYFKRLG